MADITYKRLDYDAALFLVNYMFQKLKTSPLADNTTYTLVQDGRNLLLKDGDNTTVTTLSNVFVTNNNQLTNGAGYQTASDVSSAITTALSNITGITLSVVQELPQTGAAGTIYFVANSGSGSNVYTEYIYVNGGFEKLGDKELDLSGYVQKTAMATLTNNEIATLVDSAYTTVFDSQSSGS